MSSVYYPTPQEKQAIHEWLVSHVPGSTPLDTEYQIIGVRRNDELVAAALFHDFSPVNLYLIFAATTPRWAHPYVVGKILAYPFITLGVARLSAICHIKNIDVRNLMIGLGFRHEGTHADLFPPYKGLSFGMTRKYYLKSKWYERVKDEFPITETLPPVKLGQIRARQIAEAA